MSRDFMSREEKAWRRRQLDNIDYREYMKYLPQDLRNIMANRIPMAFHDFLPPDMVADAIEKRMASSGIDPDGYKIEWYTANRPLVMCLKRLTSSSMYVVVVFRHIKEEKETVILITGDDIASPLSEIREILDGIRDDLYNRLREMGLL